MKFKYKGLNIEVIYTPVDVEYSHRYTITAKTEFGEIIYTESNVIDKAREYTPNEVLVLMTKYFSHYYTLLTTAPLSAEL